MRRSVDADGGLEREVVWHGWQVIVRGCCWREGRRKGVE